VQDYLFPDRTAEAISQVVYFVKHYYPETCQRAMPLVKHIAQYFGGHYYHVSISVYYRVSGEEAYPISSPLPTKVGEFLVRQCLDWGCVEG
ncbi:hypothetical protein QP158_11485, partial [Streptococcus agalactiae]|nr:hypothetical protein [Streptococcus agalactiae]